MKLGLILGLFLISGCMAIHQDFKGHCYHAALSACAIMESYGYDNRISIQKTDKSDKGIYHAQCEAYDPENNEWKSVVLETYPTASWGNRECGETVEYWTKEKTLEITHNRILKQ